MATVAVCRLAILKRMPATPDSVGGTSDSVGGTSNSVGGTSDSVGGTSGEGTSESASAEKWKDEDLGWFPNPKGEYTEFSNCTLPKILPVLWDHLSLQGTLSPLFRDRKKALVESSRGFESNKLQVGFCDF